MQDSPWLEKEDPRWTQQVKWIAARENFFIKATNGGLAYVAAKKCPLIEEAIWFSDACGLHDYPEGDEMISSLRIAAEMDPRAAIYVAVIDRDQAKLEEFGLAGDPIAQGHVDPRGHKDEVRWLAKSMQGGYSESFVRFAAIYQVCNDIKRAVPYLQTGIRAGSSHAMIRYSKIAPIDLRDKIYWAGRAWLEQTPETECFTFECRLWHQKFVYAKCFAEHGFIYGYIFERAGQSLRLTMRDHPINIGSYTALCAARNLYTQMCSKTQEAVYRWCLVGKQLGVVKDIINVIAKLVWRSRDQVDWFVSN